MKKWIIGALALLVLLAAMAWTVLRVEQIAPGVELISPRYAGLGANVIVASFDGQRLVIDTQLPALASLVHIYLGSFTARDQVLITHWHPDHSGGYPSLSGLAQVWSTDATLRRLSKPQVGHHLTAPGSLHKFSARDVLPKALADGQTRLLEADITIHSAAHTEADIVVFLPGADVLVVGDLVWPTAFPFVDVHSGGSVSGLIRALDALIAQAGPQTIIVPGHGAIMSLQQLVHYRDMVRSSAWAIHCNAEPIQLEEYESWSSALMPIERWQEVVSSDTSLSDCGEDP